MRFAENIWIAEWIAAVGQALGAIGTAVAVWVALRVARKDRRWREKERADRDAAQARLVTVSLDVEYQGGGFQTSALIKNSSAEPILNLTILRIWSPSTPEIRWSFGYHIQWDYVWTMEQVFAPRSDLRIPIECDNPPKPSDPAIPDHITIEFTDSNGLRWRRTDTQTPERIIVPMSSTQETIEITEGGTSVASHKVSTNQLADESAQNSTRSHGEASSRKE